MASHLLTTPTKKTNCYRILSLGQRGVGKTVFLAGAYLDLRDSVEEIKVDSLDSVTEQNVLKLLGHIRETGDYPPPSVKISNFNFALKMSVNQRKKVLYNFSWSDVPGEICEPDNENFQELVFNSHGCCVFFDAFALVNQPDYVVRLNKIMQQLLAVASLTAKNGIFYPISLVFTKCDLLGVPPSDVLSLEPHLTPITDPLDTTGVIYKTFYSAVRIAKQEGDSKVVSRGGAGAAIFWLTQELLNINQRGEIRRLASQLHSLSFPSLRAYTASGSSLKTKLINSKVFALLGLLAFVSLASWFGITWYERQVANSPDALTARSIEQYRGVLRAQPENTDALINLANLLIQKAEYSGAIELMQRLVKVQPQEIEWQMNLARLYAVTQQPKEAQKIYDSILNRDGNNVDALQEKAILLASTDKAAAKELATKAMRYASPAAKPKISQLLNSLSN
ncbi:hypothetical protein C7B80_05450 [Cyanosarcina cf. burmensis CCALA 770]|jgi:hypothetical protein|nr:hypothetical protein C7B80_05450 [Cyanosarcina cf. burmensis CCALA 770]